MFARATARILGAYVRLILRSVCYPAPMARTRGNRSRIQSCLIALAVTGTGCASETDPALDLAALDRPTPVTAPDKTDLQMRVETLVEALVMPLPPPTGEGHRPLAHTVTVMSTEVADAQRGLIQLGPAAFPYLVQFWNDERPSYSLSGRTDTHVNVGAAVREVIGHRLAVPMFYKIRKTAAGDMPQPTFRAYVESFGPEVWAKRVATWSRDRIRKEHVGWCIDEENKRGFVSKDDEERILKRYEKHESTEGLQCRPQPLDPVFATRFLPIAVFRLRRSVQEAQTEEGSGETRRVWATEGRRTLYVFGAGGHLTRVRKGASTPLGVTPLCWSYREQAPEGWHGIDVVGHAGAAMETLWVSAEHLESDPAVDEPPYVRDLYEKLPRPSSQPEGCHATASGLQGAEWTGSGSDVTATWSEGSQRCRLTIPWSGRGELTAVVER